MTNQNEEMNATITAKAELERTFGRQLIEVASSMMAKNLTAFLDQLDQKEAARVQHYEEAIGKALAPLMAEFRSSLTAVEAQLETVNTRHERQIDDLTKQVGQAFERLNAKREWLQRDKERIDALEIEVQRIAAELSARPSPEKAAATYEGVRRILDHLGLDADAA